MTLAIILSPARMRGRVEILALLLVIEAPLRVLLILDHLLALLCGSRIVVVGLRLAVARLAEVIGASVDALSGRGPGGQHRHGERRVSDHHLSPLAKSRGAYMALSVGSFNRCLISP
jgi:hypothetical protein